MKMRYLLRISRAFVLIALRRLRCCTRTNLLNKLYCSTETEICCGVPQGSNLYLLNCLQTTKAFMFADDTNLSCTEQTSIKHKLKMWITSGNMDKKIKKITLGIEKTEYSLSDQNIGYMQYLNLQKYYMVNTS